jgi:UDP-N-acetylglucosamine acyltransferase
MIIMISNLAYVHPDARLGENVTVEAFTYISENTVIGGGTWIGPHATILYEARIGMNWDSLRSSYFRHTTRS